MPTFTMTKNWDDGTVLTEAMLDDIKTSTETFINTTKLDTDNIQAGGIATGNLADALITSAKMAANSVATVSVIDANITLAKLAADIAAALVPAGSILAYGAATAPTGYLLCNGTSYLRTDYPALFTAIGTKHGTADGTHFNVPDYRGRFLRGVDSATARDPDAASRTAMATGGATGDDIGTLQADAFKAHVHDVGVNSASPFTSEQAAQGQQSIAHNFSSGSTGGSETRPINATVWYIIKT